PSSTLTLLCSSAAHHRALHSFPTRRSSDLQEQVGLDQIHERARLRRRQLALAHHHAVAARREETIERPGHQPAAIGVGQADRRQDRKSTRLNSSHVKISYAVFCLKKKKQQT